MSLSALHSRADRRPSDTIGPQGLWRAFLAGLASIELFPSPQRPTESIDPWTGMWLDVRSDWEAVGQDIRNAADRLSS